MGRASGRAIERERDAQTRLSRPPKARDATARSSNATPQDLKMVMARESRLDERTADGSTRAAESDHPIHHAARLGLRHLKIAGLEQGVGGLHRQHGSARPPLRCRSPACAGVCAPIGFTWAPSRSQRPRSTGSVAPVAVTTTSQAAASSGAVGDRPGGHLAQVVAHAQRSHERLRSLSASRPDHHRVDRPHGGDRAARGTRPGRRRPEGRGSARLRPREQARGQRRHRGGAHQGEIAPVHDRNGNAAFAGRTGRRDRKHSAESARRSREKCSRASRRALRASRPRTAWRAVRPPSCARAIRFGVSHSPRGSARNASSSASITDGKSSTSSRSRRDRRRTSCMGGPR